MERLPQTEEEVIGVLPWQHVSWHLIRIPQDAQKVLLSEQGRLSSTHANAPSSKAHQLLEGLLEEQLLDDLSLLHWITGKVQSPDDKDPQASTLKEASLSEDPHVHMWVACCSKAWLKSILSALEENHIIVQRLVPEFEPSMTAAHLYAMDAPMGLEFVLTQPSGVMGFPKEALSALTSSFNASLNASISSSLRIHIEPSVSDQLAHLLQGEMRLLTRAQRLLEASQSTWDFARGEWGQGPLKRILKALQKAKTQFLHQKEWKLARIGLLLLFTLNVIFLNTWSWQERQNIKHQREQLSQILKSTFAEVQVVVDPVSQMQRSLSLLQERTATPHPGDFEHLLSALSQLQTLNPSLDLSQIQNLRFGANELTLTWKNPMSSLSSGAIKMPPDLKAQGYDVFSQGAQTHLRWSMM